MKNHLPAFVILFLAIFTFTSNAAEISAKPIHYEFGTKYTLNSKLMNEKRALLVHLPDGYKQSSKKYPVVYLLDGDAHFKHAVTAANVLHENDLIPQVIIVAISNNEGTRARDLTSNRSRFTAFVVDEVPEFISGEFRTNGQRTLFGHSAMGGLSLFLMRGENTDIFDHYIVASPSIGMKSVDSFERIFKSKGTLKKSLYFTMGGIESEQEAINPAAIKGLAELLKKTAPKDFKWHYDDLPEQVHMTTPYDTLYRGLTRVLGE